MVNHFLNALKEIHPEAAPLLDAFAADEAEMDAAFEQRRAEQRAKMEQMRADSGAAIDRLTGRFTRY